MKTAILLSGHLRTWHLCKDMLIDSIHKIYGDDVDFFVAIWRTSTSTEEEVRDFLLSKNVNLRSIKFFDLEKNKFSRDNDARIETTDHNALWQVTQSICAPSYLKQIVSRDKRIYEFQNDIIYDRVIYARPDTIYVYNKNDIANENRFAHDLKHFSMQIRGDFQERAYEIVSPNSHDVMPITGSLSSDLYGFMHLDLNDIYGVDRKIRFRAGETHAYISYFLNRHFISLDMRAVHNDIKSWIWPVVIRPSSNIEKLRQEYEDWDYEFISAGEHDQFWFQQNVFDEKIKWCEKMNIDKRDYGF
jgi:hypothetical protein